MRRSSPSRCSITSVGGADAEQRFATRLFVAAPRGRSPPARAPSTCAALSDGWQPPARLGGGRQRRRLDARRGLRRAVHERPARPLRDDAPPARRARRRTTACASCSTPGASRCRRRSTASTATCARSPRASRAGSILGRTEAGQRDAAIRLEMRQLASDVETLRATAEGVREEPAAPRPVPPRSRRRQADHRRAARRGGSCAPSPPRGARWFTAHIRLARAPPSSVGAAPPAGRLPPRCAQGVGRTERRGRRARRRTMREGLTTMQQRVGRTHVRFRMARRMSRMDGAGHRAGVRAAGGERDADVGGGAAGGDRIARRGVLAAAREDAPRDQARTPDADSSRRARHCVGLRRAPPPRDVHIDRSANSRRRLSRHPRRPGARADGTVGGDATRRRSPRRAPTMSRRSARRLRAGRVPSTRSAQILAGRRRPAVTFSARRRRPTGRRRKRRRRRRRRRTWARAAYIPGAGGATATPWCGGVCAGGSEPRAGRAASPTSPRLVGTRRRGGGGARLDGARSSGARPPSRLSTRSRRGRRSTT